MKYEIITYATHSQGMFDRLINNKFDVNIKILGWGRKWKDFLDKDKGVLEYIESKDDNDIIIFLDAFDSLIIKDPRIAVKSFLEMDIPFLCSADAKTNDIFGTYIANGINESSCVDHVQMNSGMYIGYVGFLKRFLKDVIQTPYEKSNQRIYNKLCAKYNISVDTKELIFHNSLISEDKVGDIQSVFVSFPSSSNEGYRGKFYRRVIRGFQEYSYIFIKEYLLMFVLLIVIFLKLN